MKIKFLIYKIMPLECFEGFWNNTKFPFIVPRGTSSNLQMLKFKNRPTLQYMLIVSYIKAVYFYIL